MAIANARLIAAAPDMHAEIARLLRENEALVQALQAVHAHYREPQCLEALVPVIRAALRSATEGEPT